MRKSPNAAGKRAFSTETGMYVDALDGTTASLAAAAKRSRKRKGKAKVAGGAAPSRNRQAGIHVAAVAKRRAGLQIGIIVLGVVLALGLCLGGFFLIRNIVHPYEGADVPDGLEVTVVVPEGSSGSEVLGALLDAGVVHSTADFRKAVKNQNADQSLRSGTYTFKTGSDPADVVKQLVSGPNTVKGQLKVPEGLTVKQTARLVESSLDISESDFLEQAKASTYVSDFPFLSEAGDDSLEGFLYPKTYDFAGKKETSDLVIRAMLSQYQSEVEDLDFDSAKEQLTKRYGINVSTYDILKIASIIEKEALTEADRDKVSSVFYNRLSDGMALQSDATMSYVTGGQVTSEDLKKDSPYNTYFYKGLPPTPICTPSLWAIEAAMNPADTDYLFFFIIETDNYSNHTFNETFEQHASQYAQALEEQKAADAAADKNGSGSQTETKDVSTGTATASDTED